MDVFANATNASRRIQVSKDTHPPYLLIQMYSATPDCCEVFAGGFFIGRALKRRERFPAEIQLGKANLLRRRRRRRTLCEGRRGLSEATGEIHRRRAATYLKSPTRSAAAFARRPPLDCGRRINIFDRIRCVA